VLEIGSSLREARRRQGLELSDAAEAIMVRARFLEALESERFELLPEGPYLRSFLREYAEFLGLDGDILVTELMLRFTPREHEAPEAPKRDAKARIATTLQHRRGLLLTAALAVLALGVWWLGRSSPTTVRAAAPTLRHAAPPTTHVAAPPRVVAVHRAAPKLALTAARGPCWLLVRRGSATGPTVEEATLQPGRTIEFGLKQPLWIRLGAPWNVDASLGGRAVTASLPARIGDVLVSWRGVKTSA
jgi:transcriptional regulator with XRE-family HTH domain